MNNASFIFREPKNEPVYAYAPGSAERKLLREELDRQFNQEIEIPLIIGGKEVKIWVRWSCQPTTNMCWQNTTKWVKKK